MFTSSGKQFVSLFKTMTMTINEQTAQNKGSEVFRNRYVINVHKICLYREKVHIK